MEITIRGCAVRVAQTPKELLTASRAAFPTPDAGMAALESLEAMWENGTGLVLDGGACFLENLGDGTYGMTITASLGCSDLAAAFRSAIDYAFAATDCMRLVTSAESAEGAARLELQGFCVFNTSEVATGAGSVTVYHLGLDLDTWLPSFGPRLFYVEACRAGNAEKGYRSLQRWARFYGDPSVLSPDDLPESGAPSAAGMADRFAREMLRREAMAAELMDDDEITSWTLEHTPGCTHQLLSLDCPCGLVAVFLSSRTVVSVGQRGEPVVSPLH